MIRGRSFTHRVGNRLAPMQDPVTDPSSTPSTSTLNEQSPPTSATAESISSKSEYGTIVLSEKVAPRVAWKHVHLPPRPGTARVNNVRRTHNERGSAS
uniref:Uncharacterized protein n=1 Tax=Ascaris lumbricoides TaxID=6252 RepID=A0A0M3HT52_ASCLU